MRIAGPRAGLLALLSVAQLFLALPPAAAADLDCAKLLVPADVKTACGKAVSVVYAQAAPTLGNGCTVMLKTSAGDSLRFDLSSYAPELARRMFDLRNPDTEKDSKDVSGLGDRARQYHLTNLDVDTVRVLAGSRVLLLWAGKKEEAQVCSYAQMQQLARTILGRLPK